MRFEHNPQLILNKDEFDTLNKAFQLCRDMDNMTSGNAACQNCPIEDNCTHMCVDCIYIRAQDALKKIIDMSVVK